MERARVFWVLMCVLAVGSFASAELLNFEALAHTGTQVFYDSISEDGFTLSSDGMGIAITGSSGFADQVDSYKGSATAWTSDEYAAYLVKDDSGLFDLDFIDLARFSDYWTGSVVVTITGYNGTGTQVASQSFTLPDTGDETLHTYALDSSFSGIYKASWTQFPGYFQFDNIVINAIPEPCTLMLLGLGGLLLRKRRDVRG